MHDLGPASTELARVVGQARNEDLDRPTPCGAWTVRDLVGHLLAFSAHFIRVARHDAGGAGGAPEDLPADWNAVLQGRLAELDAVWSEPAAWEGEGSAGGLTMPNAQLGVVALEELVLHGWDLAQAIGAGVTVRDEDLAVVAEFVAGFEHVPDEGRAGLYGPIVQAPAETELERVLTLAGRDPRRPVAAASSPSS